MGDQSRCQQLDAEILDAASELLSRLAAAAEHVARRLAVPPFFIKALHTLERPMAMKDLGRRMHCDPSFVTTIADMLEQRGLATREAQPGDRRVKNLVLTDAGLALKQQVERDLAASGPWSHALTEAEREQLVRLLAKMLAVEPHEGAAGTDALDGAASRPGATSSPGAG